MSAHTRSAAGDRHLSREELTEMLSAAEAAEVTALADEVLNRLPDGAVQVTRPAETGSVVAQVREPVAGQRFILGDIVASTAEVVIDTEAGWAMRLGDDRQAALAQAVLDAEVLRDGPLAGRVRALAETVDARRRTRRTDEWARLAPTIVEFEEIV